MPRRSQRHKEEIQGIDSSTPNVGSRFTLSTYDILLTDPTPDTVTITLLSGKGTPISGGQFETASSDETVVTVDTPPPTDGNGEAVVTLTPVAAGVTKVGVRYAGVAQYIRVTVE